MKSPKIVHSDRKLTSSKFVIFNTFSHILTIHILSASSPGLLQDGQVDMDNDEDNKRYLDVTDNVIWEFDVNLSGAAHARADIQRQQQ